MSTSKFFDRICVIAVAAALVLTVLFMNGSVLDIPVRADTMGYEDKLFDTSKVHTIDIIIDDWEGFLSTAQSEEYTICDVVIDGEAINDVGIRGKGNTSLSTVASMDSDRYSFKIEFDQYDSAKRYYGLDKLSLNNLIQDNTMMKDYLTYRMMNEFGVAAPLCSYVYITVNGQDWGLYLAVEAVEDSFLQRNYGSDYGELYKPDSMEMGGGRGNGRGFDFEGFMDSAEDSALPSMPGNMQGGQMMPGMNGDPSGQPGFDPSQMGQSGMPGGFGPGQMGGEQPTMPEGFDPNQMGGEQPTMPEGFDPSQMGGNRGQGSFDPSQIGGGMGMGSGDTKLQYIDDQTSSYSAIFDNAKTDVTAADQQRLIRSLKSLSEGENLETVVDIEDVIRYFVVHNFVVNADSYTGSMVHNYYLYEEDGQISMIPWDYNLAFGTFQGGDASAMVSDDIDAPLSVTGSDRPMIDWIFASEEYTELYHTSFREFLDTVDAASIIEQTKLLIAPFVETDPTKFCTYEEFEKGVQTLSDFCALRRQSVADQLAGGSGAVDASSLTLSDMGTMNLGGRNPGGETGIEARPAPDVGNTEIQRPGLNGDLNWSQSTPQASTSPLLLTVTFLILLFGLIFAFRFRR